MLESTHGGVFTDRLAVAGSEDQLLYGTSVLLSDTMQSHALVSYTGTGTRLGLELLSAQRVDASCLHCGRWMKARNGILLYCRITPNTRIGLWSVRLKEKE